MTEVRITVNGQPQTAPAGTSVAGLLATPGVQSALKARAFKGRIDPMAGSDVPARGIAAGVVG